MQDVFKRKRLAGQSLRGRDWQGSYWVLKIYHWRVDALTVSITLLQVSDTRIATTLALDCSCHPTLAADEFYSFGTDCSFPSTCKDLCCWVFYPYYCFLHSHQQQLIIIQTFRPPYSSPHQWNSSPHLWRYTQSQAAYLTNKQTGTKIHP